MTSLGRATALVTGASRGIGRDVALALAREGVRLLLTSRGGTALEAVGRETGAPTVEADLARVEEADRLAGVAREHFGDAPHILVNAAGVFDLAPVAEVPVVAFQRHLDVNLRAPFLLVRALLPGMLARGEGWLVHVGSVAGRRGFPQNAAYSASKFGLRGLHEVLRAELAGTGVRSFLVEPGPVNTGAWDAVEQRLGRDLPARDSMLGSDTVAEAVVFCLRMGAAGASSDLLVLPR